MPKLYDGHAQMAGVDTTADPVYSGRGLAFNAVNRSFRGGRNRTRPAFMSRILIFDTPENENIFRKGAISGAFGYRKMNKSTFSQIIVAVHDRLLKGVITNNSITFSLLYKGIDPAYMHSFFVQGVDRLYWQNGIQRPVGWNGVEPAYVVEEKADGMPIGNVMAYIHGRLAIFTDSNYALISDHIYGNTLQNTKGLESFIEIQQFNDIGAVPAPATLGPVFWARPISRQPNRNAQGELLVACANGFFLLDISRERSSWLFGDIQQIAVTGRGSSSPHGHAGANNDIWYQSTDGTISSYQFDRNTLQTAWGDQSLSYEVQKYIDYTDASRLQFVSAIRAYNRMIFSCAITLTASELGGTHRFGEGMVALDFYKSRNTQQTGFAWDGLWTGVNPVQFVSVEADSSPRHFCVSHDDDGNNRIYEFVPGYGDDDLDGARKKIIGFYDTAALFATVDPTQPQLLKELAGIRAPISDADGEVSVKVAYRPNFYNDWIPLESTTVVGSDNMPESLIQGGNSQPFYGYLLSGSPDADTPEQASYRLTHKATHWQFRVYTTGSLSIPLFQVQAEPMWPDGISIANPDDRRYEQRIITGGDDFFSYKIAT